MAYICENLSSTSARRDTRKINGSHLILTDKLLGSICHRQYTSFDSRLASTHSFAMRTALSESIFGKLRSWFRRSLSHREATALTNLWCIVDCSQYQGAHWCSRWKSWAPAGNIDWGIRQRPALNMPEPRPVAPITSVTPLHYARILSAWEVTVAPYRIRSLILSHQPEPRHRDRHGCSLCRLWSVVWHSSSGTVSMTSAWSGMYLGASFWRNSRLEDIKICGADG